MSGREPDRPPSGGRRSSPASPKLWIATFTAIVVGVAVAFAVSFPWHQTASPRSQRYLEAQREGFQAPALRFCLGLAQIVDETGRGQAAVRADSSSDLDDAVSAIKDGYRFARNAQDVVRDASVDSLRGPLDALDRATSGPRSGLARPETVSAALSGVRREAAALLAAPRPGQVRIGRTHIGDASCSNVLAFHGANR